MLRFAMVYCKESMTMALVLISIADSDLFCSLANGSIGNDHLITLHQLSCRKAVLSVVCVCVCVCVCLFTSGSPTIQGPPLFKDMTTRHVQTCSTWTSLYSPPPPEMFKIIHYEACTVGKQVVGILLECFLAILLSLSLL